MNIKPYPGNPRYLVCDDGTILGPGRGPKSAHNMSRHKELKPHINDGYKFAGIYWKETGITKRIPYHKMVLETFVGPRPPGMEAGHLNGNRLDNRPENLRWITQMENQIHRREHGTLPLGEMVHSAKLTEALVKQGKLLWANGMKLTEIAKLFAVNRSTIARIISGKTWKHIENTH